MKKPILVIMAAGMGSRYGGLKQIDPVGRHGEIILDYSLFDAKRAGFEKAVIVIKKENRELFQEVIGRRASRYIEIEYAYQELTDLPEGYAVPEGRVKPWGTGHAIWAARKLVDAPFCAVNADDFYGAEAFRLAYEHLTNLRDEGDVAMVGYLLKNTLCDTGYVSRGVCQVNDEGRLTSIVERTHIISTMDGPLMTEDLHLYTRLDPESVVSMNLWAFPRSMMDALEAGFPAFLKENADPLKGEYFLPKAVDDQMKAGRATVKVHITRDKWYGVTNPADKQTVIEAVRAMAENGLYPAPLWPEA